MGWYFGELNIFSEPTGDLKKCFLQNLNSRVLSKLSQGRPEKRGLRKKAKRAYNACAEFISNTNKNNNTANKSAPNPGTNIGRKRIKKWGERLIDIDILFYNNNYLQSAP